MRAVDALRWGACFSFVLTFHAAGAMALLAQWNSAPDLVTNAPVIMIELAPLPVAPQATPSEVAPGPLQNEATPEPEPKPQPQPEPEKPVTRLEPDPVKPIEKAELPPLPETPQAEPVPAVTPPPKVQEPKEVEKEKKQVEKPKEKKRRHRHASIASAPSAADREATRSAAASPGARSHNPDAMPNWKSALVARLEHYKRYPPEAQTRGEHGVAQLAFSVDRTGGVHHPRIVRSSGSRALDAATLALVARAAPLPPPPPEVPGTQIAITVPIRYNMR
jgi:periplasmic protein TonB